MHLEKPIHIGEAVKGPRGNNGAEREKGERKSPQLPFFNSHARKGFSYTLIRVPNRCKIQVVHCARILSR